MTLSHTLKPPTPFDMGMVSRPHTGRVRKSPRKTARKFSETQKINLDDSNKHPTLPIELPIPPKTAPIQSPRNLRNLTEKEQFFADVDKYLEEQLREQVSDSDKLYVYKKCFDFLCQDFKIIRPLLERIKKEYDRVANDLIDRKRKILTDNELSFAPEDSYSMTVTQLRNAKNKEFKHLREEADQKLDILTELRLQRSSLMKTLEQLEEKNVSIQKDLDAEEAKIVDITIKNEQLKAETKITKAENKEHLKTMQQLESNLNKTTTGVEQLQKSKTIIKSKLEEIQAYKSKLSEEVAILQKQKNENEANLLEKSRKVADMEKERTNNTEKLRSITQRNAQNETKMRSMLKDVAILGGDNTTLPELYSRLIKRRRRVTEEQSSEETEPQTNENTDEAQPSENV